VRLLQVGDVKHNPLGLQEVLQSLAHSVQLFLALGVHGEVPAQLVERPLPEFQLDQPLLDGRQFSLAGEGAQRPPPGVQDVLPVQCGAAVLQRGVDLGLRLGVDEPRPPGVSGEAQHSLHVEHHTWRQVGDEVGPTPGVPYLETIGFLDQDGRRQVIHDRLLP